MARPRPMSRLRLRERIDAARNLPALTRDDLLAQVDTTVAAMPKLGEVAIAVAGDGWTHEFCTGAMTPDARFATGSVSKLFTHAILFRLIDDGQLSYDTPVASRVPSGSLDGLHVIAGQDYGSEITVRHLVDQTSGLASWEDTKDPGGRTLVEQIVDWDRVVDVDEQMETSARVGAKFPPGQGNRAHYSDLNAELASQVAQFTTGASFQELVNRYILVPLGMEYTTFVIPGRHDYAEIRTAKHPVWISRYLSSSPGSGGIISTSRDLLTFIRAFHTGVIFDRSHIEDPVLRRIQYRPLRYGAGMMADGPSRIPRMMRRNSPVILGHSGVPGSFAFHCPDEDVFLAGTVNSILVQPFEVIERYLAAV